MKLRYVFALLVSHGLVGAFGFAGGIYALPILIAPEAPSTEEVASVAQNASFTAEFRRDLAGSDSLHWGEGEVHLSPQSISLMGRLSPGPDYKLYLTSEFVETEAEFNQIKASAVRLGDIKTFENFLIDVPASVDVAQYNTVVVWCETFGEFITAAQYQ